jgi:4-carboxymuconolactone decarboxylase
VKREDEDLLRRLALNDEGVLEALLGPAFADAEPEGLDAKAQALVRLAGLVALESAAASYQWGVTAALAAGATDGEIVGVLAALAPIVGTARVTSAAPEVAVAIGCDLGVSGDR